MLIVLYLTGKNHDLRNFLFVLFLFFLQIKRWFDDKNNFIEVFKVFLKCFQAKKLLKIRFFI
jgi:hypothetical protein